MACLTMTAPTDIGVCRCAGNKRHITKHFVHVCSMAAVELQPRRQIYTDLLCKHLNQDLLINSSLGWELRGKQVCMREVGSCTCASSVCTERKCRRSLLLPTSMMTMLESAWSLSSFNHRSTFSKVTAIQNIAFNIPRATVLKRASHAETSEFCTLLHFL